jgi:hypothetical protein
LLSFLLQYPIRFPTKTSWLKQKGKRSNKLSLKKYLSFKTYTMKVVLTSIFLLLYCLNALAQKRFNIKPQPVDGTLYAVHNTVMLKGPSVLMDDNRFVWCGSVVKGNDSLYHMFFSTWSCDADSMNFYNSWVLQSQIGYATSKFPDRDFVFKKIVLRGRRFDGDTSAWDAQVVHNPSIKKFNNKYYLYYAGSKDPGVQPPGSTGANLSKRDRVQQMQQIGVIEFSSFDEIINGTFVRPDQPILSPRTRVKKDNIVNPSPKGTIAKPDNIIVTNPSVTYRPSDKKYLLYFKGNWYDPAWRGVHGVAVSDNPAGPFVSADDIVFDVRTEDGKIANAEDPFVWYYEKYQCFFVIVKDFTGKITGGEPSLALLSSKDGIRWEKPENSLFMNKELKLKNGSLIKLFHLERPFLLLDDFGKPLVFYGAATINSPANQKITGTFNVHVPLIVE